MGEDFDISDAKLKRRIVDNIEGVLYQYSGEIVVPESQQDYLDEYSIDLGECGGSIFYIENVNGGFAFPWKFKAVYTFTDTIEGCFYSRIVGKDNPDIEAELGKLRQLAMNS